MSVRAALGFVTAIVALASCSRPEVAIRKESLPEPAPTQVRAPREVQGDAEVQLPRPPNGVLPPGAADKVLAAGSPPLVRLLDGGQEPRADMSYALVKGTTQRMGMGTDMLVAVKVKGQAVPATRMPHMTMTLDANAADKNPGGDHRIDSRLVSITVEPNGGQEEQIARALRPQLDAMKGIGIGYWVSTKGQVRDVRLDIPPTVPPAAKQIMSGMSESFESMVIPLPTGVIGIGGRWQVVARVSRGGADLLQSTVYTVRSRTGNKVGLDFTVVQLAGGDSIHTAQMPAGMSAKIKSFASSGTGSMALDLKSVVPEGGTMSVKSSMELAVGADESSVDTTTNVQLARP